MQHLLGVLFFDYHLVIGVFTLAFAWQYMKPFGAKLVEFCATLRLLCKCGHIFKTSGNWQSYSCNGIGRGGGGGVGGDGGTGCWLCLWLFFCQMLGGSAEIIWRRRCLTFLYLVHISFAYLVWCVCISVHFLHSAAFLLFSFCKRHAGMVLQNKICGMQRKCFPRAAGTSGFKDWPVISVRNLRPDP